MGANFIVNIRRNNEEVWHDSIDDLQCIDAPDESHSDTDDDSDLFVREETERSVALAVQHSFDSKDTPCAHVDNCDQAIVLHCLPPRGGL